MENTLSEFELKAQARRLRTALSDKGCPVSHTEALDLVARVHGRRNWKELVGLKAAGTARAPAAVDESVEFLARHLQCAGFSECDLDDLVHDTLAPSEASSVNNQGMSAQLQALLQACGSFDALLAHLRQSLDSFSYEKPAIYARAWGPDSPCVEFDALPWFMAASAEQIQALFNNASRGLGNCDVGDLVFEHCLNTGRTKARNDSRALQGLQVDIARAQAVDPTKLGVTVDISRSDAQAFVETAYAHKPDTLADLLEALHSR